MFPINSYMTGPQLLLTHNWPPAVSTSGPLLIHVSLPGILSPSFSHDNSMNVSSRVTSLGPPLTAM